KCSVRIKYHTIKHPLLLAAACCDSIKDQLTRRRSVAERLSRKELKQDRIHDAIEHGAEAVYSHSQAAAILIAVAIAAVLVYGGLKFYNDCQTDMDSLFLDVLLDIVRV